MTKVIICGAFGRMGTTIAQMVLENPELEFAGGVDIREGELHGKPVVTSDKLADFIDSAKPDVMIDFTVAAATMVNAKIAAEKGQVAQFHAVHHISKGKAGIWRAERMTAARPGVAEPATWEEVSREAHLIKTV